MKIVYRLEAKQYWGHDKEDDEDIETTLLLGHFSSLTSLKNAIKECLAAGYPEERLFISSFFDTFTSRQKYVYVLSHMYSVLQDDRYTDYEYIFPPYSNRKKCLALKEELIKKDKFAPNPNRIYDSEFPDGFTISKTEIDVLYGYPFRKKEIEEVIDNSAERNFQSKTT